MKIRKAVRTDVEVIADFNVRLARESEGLRLELKTVTAGVAALLADPAKGIYFVAETAEGEVAGQLMITYEWSDWRNGNMWWLQSVYVKEEFRRRGVFQELFTHVEALARQSPEVRALRLYLEKNNERARGAYKKLGMKQSHYEVMEFEISR